jgi:hypothetical protein
MLPKMGWSEVSTGAALGVPPCPLESQQFISQIEVLLLGRSLRDAASS